MTAERRATLWLVFLCALWGSSFFTMQGGTQALEGMIGERAAPSGFLFLRFLAAFLLLPCVLPSAIKAVTPRVALHGFLLALPFYVGFILQVDGLRQTTPTVSAFLTNLTVVFTPALGWLFFRERPGWGLWMGAALALAGVWILCDPAGGRFGRGEILTVGCAVAFTLQIQFTNVVTRRSPPDAVTLVMFACGALFAGLTLLVMGISWGGLARAAVTPAVGWPALYNAVACTVVANTLMNRFQRDITPTRAAVIYTLEPIFAALFSAIFISEPMTGRKLLGGAGIVLGNLACERVGRRSGK